MHRKIMSSPQNIIDQLEEALEERQVSDRRKSDASSEPSNGADRRKNDRRKPSSPANVTKH